MLFRVRVKGLELRDGVWKYRRGPAAPPGHHQKRQVVRPLHTDDRTKALRELPAAKAAVDRIFADAEAALKNRAVGDYSHVKRTRQHSEGAPRGRGGSCPPSTCRERATGRGGDHRHRWRRGSGVHGPHVRPGEARREAQWSGGRDTAGDPAGAPQETHR